MRKILVLSTLIGSLLLSLPGLLLAQAGEVPITVEQAQIGAPVTFGIPFPKGELYSPEHVRVLTAGRQEIASQITPVTTWLPADESIKWIWVDFFTEGSGQYIVEYGPEVTRTVQVESPIRFTNNQRDGAGAQIDTGPLRFSIGKRGGGFLDLVEFNPNGDGFTAEHVIAEGIDGRGSFLDLINDAGVDASTAVVQQQFIEKGSGPLHAILRVIGEYQYEDPDHPAAPFVTYIHAYAGKPYVKVYHTITYTGNPDKAEPLNGREHVDLATQSELLIDEAARSADPGITTPHDMIAAAGFGLNYKLAGDAVFRTGLRDGPWYDAGEPVLIEMPTSGERVFSLKQTGPSPNGLNPSVEMSSRDRRIGGFAATLSTDQVIRETERSEGWVDISDGRRGVSIGIRNMLEEYPNAFEVNVESGQIHAYIWPPSEAPKSFERWTDRGDGGMVANFAQGITKTTEFILNFHDGSDDIDAIRNTMNIVLDPAAAHADPSWYRNSGVYGTFATADNSIPALERGLQYKYQYMQFAQKWEPWYGMFDYGDLKIYYRNGQWTTWGNNEPAQDFQWWLNYMRTGDRSMYLVADGMSRHTMDVDNTHWPVGPSYRGDTNSPLDYWRTLDLPEGSPYLGMGARHSEQQAISKLTAHVWVPGWIASYYLNGYHRGLEVAKLTGDYYIRRVWGEHGLTGRRLYLSIWNLAELYDATEDERYGEELQFRVDKALALAKNQGGRLVIDRYGYSQNYASHGFSKYLQMFDDRDVERAMVTHARSLLATPPYDHEMESYLATIHALVRAYDLTGESVFLQEACQRATNHVTNEMPRSFESYRTQGELAVQMENASNLPGAFRGEEVFTSRGPIWAFSGGLRIFGWTHAFGVPYLIDRLQDTDHKLGSLPCS